MIQTTRRLWLKGVGAAAVLGGGYGWAGYRHALNGAENRISGHSATIRTPSGMLEYAAAGAGPPLLMIHGTGGGFDQGLRFGSALRQRGYQIVAPSRFGYLRSDFPTDPSLANQAEAFVKLLDHLGIDRLPVIGGSAGALSAMSLALRHPDRCTALILLVPAMNVSGTDPVEMSALQQQIVRLLLNSDALYWTASQLAPGRLIGTLLATNPDLLPTVSVSERERAFAILSEMMPIHARARGMLNDASQAGHPARMDISRLSVPLLLISANDDRFGTAVTARKIAKILPHAELTIFLDGGHIWLGHDAEVADRIQAFVRTRSK